MNLETQIESLRKVAKGAMVYRCSIERDAALPDDWGGTGAPSWQTHLTGVPCFPVVQGGREAVSADRTAVVVDQRLLIPLGIDVNERDRVSSVTYRGQPYLDGPMDIEAVLLKPTHLELILTRVS